jgi:CRP-like cAMP-binding protein
MDTKLEMLRKVPLLAGLGRGELEAVSRLCTEVDLPAGRQLMREGETGNEFYLLIDGRVRVERGGATVATLGPGQFLGEIALVDHGPRSATAVCETDCRLMVLTHREFNSLMDTNTAIRARVLEALAQRVRQLQPDSGY